MHNDLISVVTLHDLEQRLRERDRRARHLSELQDLQRGPSLIRRGRAAVARWLTARRSRAGDGHAPIHPPVEPAFARDR